MAAAPLTPPRRRQLGPALAQLAGLLVVPMILALVLDLGGAVAVLKGANLPLIALAAAMMVLGSAVRAYRWRLVAQACGVAVLPYITFLRLYYAGVFVSAVVPSVLASFTPAVFMARSGQSGRLAAASVVIDRLVEAAVLAGLMTAAAAYLWHRLPGFVLPWGTSAPLLVLLAVALGLAAVGYPAARSLLRKASLLLAQRLARTFEVDLLARLTTPGRPLLTMLIGTSSAIIGLQVAAAFCVAAALSLNTPPLTLAATYVIVIGFAILPISLFGFGPREGLLVLLLAGPATSSEQAFALGFTISTLLLATRLLGVFAWLLCLREPRPDQSTAAASQQQAA